MSTTGCATTRARRKEVLGYLKAENAYNGGDDRPYQGARGARLRGDRRPHQAGRRVGALPAARLLVLHALRNRQGIPDLRAQGRLAGGARAGDARRERSWPRARVSTRSAAPRVAPDNQLFAYVDDTVGPPPVHAALQEPGDRRDAAGPHRERGPVRRLGRTTTDASSTSRSDPETLLAYARTPPRARHRSCAGCARLRGGRQDFLHRRSRHEGRALPPDRRAAAPSRPNGAMPTRRSATRVQAVRCRASATTSTTSTTSRAAGSSARNWQAPNFRLRARHKVGEEGDRAKWQDVRRASRRTRSSTGSTCSRTSSRSSERSGGLRKIRMRPWSGGEDFFIAADEPAYTTHARPERGDRHPHRCATRTSSLTTPDDDLRLRHAQTGEQHAAQARAGAGRLRARATTRTELVWATARDGAQVPVSLVYRKGFKRDGTAPLLPVRVRLLRLHRIDPEFSTARRVAARPRLRLRDRPRPRRPGAGPRLVRATASCSTRRTPSPTSSTSPHFLVARSTPRRQGLRHGRQRRRPADGRGRQHGAGATTAAIVAARAVRRRRDHDARRERSR